MYIRTVLRQTITALLYTATLLFITLKGQPLQAQQYQQQPGTCMVIQGDEAVVFVTNANGDGSNSASETQVDKFYDTTGMLQTQGWALDVSSVQTIQSDRYACLIARYVRPRQDNVRYTQTADQKPYPDELGIRMIWQGNECLMILTNRNENGVDYFESINVGKFYRATANMQWHGWALDTRSIKASQSSNYFTLTTRFVHK